MLISQLCNISICTRQSWQMNPTMDITTWHHMKIAAMSSGCQICSCYCDGELSFIICCACLCQLLLTVCIDLRSTEWCRGHFDQHSATHKTHNGLAFHYLRQRGLKTKNMLRNTALQCNNMTIINRKLVEMTRYCSLSKAIVHKRRIRCLCDITLCDILGLLALPLVLLYYLSFFKSNLVTLVALKSPKQVSEWTTEIHPVKSIKVLKYMWWFQNQCYVKAVTLKSLG